MSRQLAILHQARVELEALVTERTAMIAANHAAEHRGEGPKYSEQDFRALAERIRGTWVDPADFAE